MKTPLVLLALTLLSLRVAAAPIRVLIVDGYSNHDWHLTTALIRGIVEPTGLFTVGVSTAPPTAASPGWDAWRPKFSDYDVVIQTCNDLNGGAPWPRAVQAAFENFVARGGGVYVWHAGNNAFAAWPAYNDMIGLGWRKKDFGVAFSVEADGRIVLIPAGEGRDTSHGARVDTVVQRLGEHPIHAGLPRQWRTPDIEVYHHARGPAKNLTVLSCGFDPRTQLNWPLEWAVAYGEGRVYTSTFGHVWKGDTQPARMRCAGLQTIVVRALQWLARRAVTFPVPADFPTAEKISVRGEIPLPAAAPLAPDLTVAADGSGDFRTVQAAVESLPRDNRERRVILVRNGTYREKVRIDAPFVTLRGESRAGARIEFPQGANDFRDHPDPLGTAVVNLNGDDCVLENLTVENTHGVIGTHAFAIYGKADRTVIVDCDVLSQGNDTLSLWKGDSGRYYHARLTVRGSVDFVCPRGWCYMTDCTIYEVNPGASAALWHDGSKDRDMKFVLRRCRLDGVAGWKFARHHADAQLFLLDCTFSAAMRDLAPYRVTYPTNGSAPTDADRARNQSLAANNRWGERFYFFNCHRDTGDYPWHRDNLATAADAPRAEQVTAAWTFRGTWDPEDLRGPVVRRVTARDGVIELQFSETVTVKGRPRLALRRGAAAGYLSGSGGDTLRFAAPGAGAMDAAQLDFADGTIIASQASATIRPAATALP